MKHPILLGINNAPPGIMTDIILMFIFIVLPLLAFFAVGMDMMWLILRLARLFDRKKKQRH